MKLKQIRIKIEREAHTGFFLSLLAWYIVAGLVICAVAYFGGGK